MRKLIILLLGFISQNSYSKTFTADPARTLSIIGPIESGILTEAERLLSLSPVTSEKKQPITILVNSPGGRVDTGMFFINQMQISQKRGYVLNCVSGFMAASMGFQILAHCDNVYTLKFTKLLFHPPAYMTSQALNLRDLEYLLGEIKHTEHDLRQELLEKFRFPIGMFDYHFNRETMWEAYRLATYTKKIQIVSDVYGIDDILIKRQKPISILDLLRQINPSRLLFKSVDPRILYIHPSNLE
jgi:ATP-dependent protease ClpP protease subunit